MPRAVEPMAATLAATVAPDDERWGFETKWDGLRAFGYADDGGLRLTRRTLRDVTAQSSELHALADTLPGRRVVLDGEIVALDDKGPAQPPTPDPASARRGAGDSCGVRHSIGRRSP